MNYSSQIGFKNMAEYVLLVEFGWDLAEWEDEIY
jgi:hypothetical protein